jgi:post-GPI attachment to proteins factor 3
MRIRHVFYLILALAIPNTCLASSGDRDPTFRSCIAQCEQRTCASYDPSLAMRLTRWSCTDNCKYNCMHYITDHALEGGVKIQQYYGKWPFYRFAGMQEPASVIFSLANLLLHIWGLGQIRSEIPEDHPMKKFYIVWAYISCNAWVWSSVFHTRGKFHSLGCMN